jgi:hypothetical protein
VVPGFAIEGGDFGELLVGLRGGFDEGEFAVFGKDEEKVLGGEEEHLAWPLWTTVSLK